MQIYPTSCGKSCLKYIPKQKNHFCCWVDPSCPPRPPTRTGLRFAQSGRSGPGRPAIVWPDFTSKVRPGRKSRPTEASGLRPSALVSRPPALRSMHMCSNNELNYYNGKLHSHSCIIRLRAESVSHTLDAGISGVYNRPKELEFLRLLPQLMLQSILYIDRAALVSI